MRKIVIAIDGYSACGKSTTAKLVARHLGYIFIDTGAMYRAVTLHFIRRGVNVNEDSDQLRQALAEVHLEFRINPDLHKPEIYLNGENVEQAIRSMEVSAVVSEVSTHRVVREALVAQQQRMGAERGIVMDGRDIGTVVFPDAELKMFMTASLEQRIVRRRLEHEAKGEHPTDEEIRRNILHRDNIDTTRKESPLRQAEDAIVLDTSHMTIPEQVDVVLEYARKLMGEKVAVGK
jgi:cytidylate kinase